MDNKVIRLQVLDKVEAPVEKEEKTVSVPASNVSNPIYKKMLAFHHAGYQPL